MTPKLALPPRSPELNPVENVWQFMRDNWLSNRIFKSYEDIVALCSSLEQPHRPTHVPRHAQMGAWVLINDRWYNVLIAEQSEMAIYSQNGGTLPLFVSITAGGTATLEANSLAGPKDEDGDLPPDPAKIVTTNCPVFQASETETAFLPIPQWVDNGVFLPMVTGLGFDWFEKQMIAILGPIVAEGGDLDEVMRQIFQIEVVGLPVDVLGRVDLITALHLPFLSIPFSTVHESMPSQGSLSVARSSATTSPTY